MAFSSLKDFVTCLEERKNLVRIREPVSTNLEISEICDRVSKNPGGGKALLFENIFNHNNGKRSEFPVLINALGSLKRMAWAINCDHVEERAR